MSQIAPEHRTEASRERLESMSEFEQVTERMRRLLEQTFGGFSLPARIGERGIWSPLVDIEEQDDSYVVEAELPGVKRKDVNIELVGNELSITGEVKEQERKGVMRRRTRRVGRFDYRVTLPDQLDAEKVEAKLTDGVLTVKVPKSERSQRRQIAINAT